MKVIVVGCGRVGSRVAVRLANEGHEVCVVDRVPLAFDKLGDAPVRTLTGTGIDLQTLRQAGAETADILLSVTKGDNTNIMVGQIAGRLLHIPKVIVRIVDPRVKAFYETEMGLTCYCQTEVSSARYLEMMGVPPCMP